MEQSYEVRFRRLLKVSADINKRMAEVWALREAVRMAEAKPEIEGAAIHGVQQTFFRELFP